MNMHIEQPKNMTIPMVVENEGRVERSFDIYSRLLRDRIVMLHGEVNFQSASLICSQLLFLAGESDDPITLYINSPGGSVVDGLAIMDTMHHIKAPVHTVCMGMAASMGAFLLSQGEKGHRYCLPHSEVMIHQVLGGAKGQATDIQIVAERMQRMKRDLTQMLSDATYGKVDFDTMWDLCERDNYLQPPEALELGLIDEIL